MPSVGIYNHRKTDLETAMLSTRMELDSTITSSDVFKISRQMGHDETRVRTWLNDMGAGEISLLHKNLNLFLRDHK